MYFSGALCKGVWSTHVGLPDGYIVVRDESMMKVKPHDDDEGEDEWGEARVDKATISHFEVNNTSDWCPAAKLNPTLTPLLVEGARKRGYEEARARGEDAVAGGEAGKARMERYLLGLQVKEGERIRILTNTEATSSEKNKAVRQLAAGRKVPDGTLPPSAAQMLEAGFDPSRDPFLGASLVRSEEDNLAKLRNGRMHLPDSFVYIGVADMTNSLPEVVGSK